MRSETLQAWSTVLYEVDRSFAKLPPAVKYPKFVRAVVSRGMSLRPSIIARTPGQVAQSTFRMIEPCP